MTAAIWVPWLYALIPLSIFALLGWIYSVMRKNVHVIDSMWSLYFLGTSLVVVSMQPAPLSMRANILLALVVVWSLRLAVYLMIRNWGKDEDYRYQQIRANNQPHFWLKSLYIVFGLQLLLAWVIALPLVTALTGEPALGWLDIAGLVLVAVGIAWESIADWQLYRFKRKPEHAGQVLDAGLWALSRHPNYFGEACVWWGFYLMAVAAGGWWTIFSPVLMTILLLRVSGVHLLEQTIHERRPQYRQYQQSTNAFFPGPKKS